MRVRACLCCSALLFFFISPPPPSQDSLCGLRLLGWKINKNALIGRQTRFPPRRPSRRALSRGGCRSYEFMRMAEDVTYHSVQHLEQLDPSERTD